MFFGMPSIVDETERQQELERLWEIEDRILEAPARTKVGAEAKLLLMVSMIGEGRELSEDECATAAAEARACGIATINSLGAH
jgi:hypothetical protein